MSDVPDTGGLPPAEPAPTVSPVRTARDTSSLIAVGVLLLAAIFAGWYQTSGGARLSDGTVAPAFTVKKFSGGDVSLASLKGQVVVLNFWATWCPPCRDEMPYVVKLGTEFEHQGVTLVAASIDDPDTATEELEGFVGRMPALAPFAAYANGPLVAQYKVGPVPTTYVIGKSGSIYASVEGQVSESTLRRWITGALEEK